MEVLLNEHFSGFFFFFFFLELYLFNVGQKLVYTDGIHYTIQACTRSTSTVLYKRWPRTRQRVQNLTDSQGKTTTPTTPYIQNLSSPYATPETAVCPVPAAGRAIND